MGYYKRRYAVSRKREPYLYDRLQGLGMSNAAEFQAEEGRMGKSS